MQKLRRDPKILETKLILPSYKRKEISEALSKKKSANLIFHDDRGKLKMATGKKKGFHISVLLKFESLEIKNNTFFTTSFFLQSLENGFPKSRYKINCNR